MESSHLAEPAFTLFSSEKKYTQISSSTTGPEHVVMNSSMLSNNEVGSIDSVTFSDYAPRTC